MILTETKISNQAYCRNRLVSDVVCLLMITTMYGGAQGGVCLVIWDQPQGWILELTRFHGPNMVKYEVVTDGKRTPISSAYLLPYILENLTDLEEALARFRYQYTIVLGDLSADIGQVQNHHRH